MGWVDDEDDSDSTLDQQYSVEQAFSHEGLEEEDGGLQEDGARAVVQSRSYARLVSHDRKMQTFLGERHDLQTTPVPRVGEWAVQAPQRRPRTAPDK